MSYSIALFSIRSGWVVSVSPCYHLPRWCSDETQWRAMRRSCNLYLTTLANMQWRFKYMDKSSMQYNKRTHGYTHHTMRNFHFNNFDKIKFDGIFDIIRRLYKTHLGTLIGLSQAGSLWFVKLVKISHCTVHKCKNLPKKLLSCHSLYSRSQFYYRIYNKTSKGENFCGFSLTLNVLYYEWKFSYLIIRTLK